MTRNEEHKVGVFISSDKPDAPPVPFVCQNRLAVVIPTKPGARPSKMDVWSMAEFVESENFALKTTVASAQGSGLDVPQGQGCEVPVRVTYGREHPSRAEQDFLPTSLVWNTQLVSPPPGATEVERRPLLASRIEETALETVLSVLHALRSQGREAELLDPEKRRALAAALLARAAALAAARAKYPIPPKEASQ